MLDVILTLTWYITLSKIPEGNFLFPKHLTSHTSFAHTSFVSVRIRSLLTLPD